MSEWKKFNDDVKQAIEEPTNGQLIDMDKRHYKLYRLSLRIQKAKEELTEAEKEFKYLIDELDSKDLPEWAWGWVFKKSNIKWKNEFIKRLGQPEANKILSVAKQKEYPKIGIRFIDPNPEDIPKNPNQLKIPKRLTLPKPKLSLKDRIALQKGS